MAFTSSKKVKNYRKSVDKWKKELEELDKKLDSINLMHGGLRRYQSSMVLNEKKKDKIAIMDMEEILSLVIEKVYALINRPPPQYNEPQINSQFNDRARYLEQEVHRLQNELEEAKSERSKYKHKTRNVDEEKNDLKFKIRDLQNSLDMANLKSVENDRKITQLENDKFKLENKVDEMQQELKEKEKIFKDMNDEINKSKDLLRDNNIRMNTIENTDWTTKFQRVGQGVGAMAGVFGSVSDMYKTYKG